MSRKRNDITNRELFYTNWIPAMSVLLREVLNSKFSSSVSEKEKQLTADILNKVREELFTAKEYHLHKEVTEELIKYDKYNLVLPDGPKTLNLEIGMGYELQADYQGGRKEISLLGKAYYLEQALDHYIKIGEKQKIKQMKIKIKNNYENLKDNDEMKKIETEVTIPGEEMNDRVNLFIGDNVQNSLDKIATIPLISSVESISNFIQELKKDSYFQDLFSKSIINDGKKIEQVDSDYDSFKLDFNRHYMLNVELGIGVTLEKVFDRLIDEFDLTTDDIMEKFDKWGHLDQKNHPYVEAGLNRFFKGDYISSIHILVPQFESTLRNFFFKGGYPTTSVKKGSGQQDQTFNAFLDRQDIKLVLGEDVHTLIQVVMVEQTGLNLRNNIAHGTIGLNDVTRNKSIIIIYLYLVMTRYYIKETETETETETED